MMFSFNVNKILKFKVILHKFFFLLYSWQKNLASIQILNFGSEMKHFEVYDFLGKPQVSLNRHEIENFHAILNFQNKVI